MRGGVEAGAWVRRERLTVEREVSNSLAASPRRPLSTVSVAAEVELGLFVCLCVIVISEKQRQSVCERRTHSLRAFAATSTC